MNEFGRAYDVPNLFVSDGSVMTTGAAANPTLTIVALALRQAGHIDQQLKAGRLMGIHSLGMIVLTPGT